MSPSSPQSSFIPKRGPARTRVRKPATQIFIFSIITYSLIFAALLAAGASYLYLNYLKTQLQQEVLLLNTEIDTFSVSDLSRASDLDLTLKRASDRLFNNASVAEVLETLDDATIQPMQIVNLTLNREGDREFLMDIALKGQSFDGALFQRKILNTNQRFSDVSVSEVSVALVDSEGQGDSLVVTPDTQTIEFSAEIIIPLTEVSYIIPAQARSLSNRNQTAL